MRKEMLQARNHGPAAVLPVGGIVPFCLTCADAILEARLACGSSDAEYASSVLPMSAPALCCLATPFRLAGELPEVSAV